MKRGETPALFAEPVRFVIEVFVRKDAENMEWRAVHPTRGRPYEYPTRDDAERAARCLYPDHGLKVRVTER